VDLVSLPGYNCNFVWGRSALASGISYSALLCPGHVPSDSTYGEGVGYRICTSFSTSTGLPPSRACDHTIPLIQGAQPIFVRPYRYAPLLKTEIEKQVNDMLDQGIIQKSSSAFASPVLLVKKKDSTWRFCVDYRQLNAITKKGKYPVPVIEELLDELNGAAYFTTLDLQAGFH
jgi:hypothetical protein